MLDIFSSFFGDLSSLNPNIVACLACCLGIFVIDCAFRVVLLFCKSIFNLK